MSEQQRIFLTLVLTLGILVGWQMVMDKFYPAPVVVAPVAEPAARAPAAAGDDSVPPVAAPAAPVVGADESGTGAVAASPVQAQIPAKTESFRTEVLSGEISNRGLALTRLNLLNYKERPQGDVEPGPVSLISGRGKDAYQARVNWKIGGAIQPVQLNLTRAGESLIFDGLSPNGLKINARTTPRKEAYALDYEIQIHNPTGAAISVDALIELGIDIPSDEGGGFFSPRMQMYQGMCAQADDVLRVDPPDADEGPWVSPEESIWAGLDKQYFVVAVVPHVPRGAPCSVSSQGETLQMIYGLGEESVGPGATWTRSFSLYVGPKRDEQFEQVSPALSNVIDFSIWGIPLGFFARPMILLLNLFHGFTQSWGIAIILLTLVVKSLLFPITYKSVVSMRKMQLLKPELDKIKERFPDDRERQQMEQIKLFKERGVNPLGGCLPMLAQMPVWFALYRALWTCVDLYEQSFMWIPDLTAKEPFPFLALALGAITFVQQRITPTAADSQQAKVMMYMMPIMFTVFMVALPSGLVLYIFVNSVLTIFQQLAINKKMPVPQ